MRRPARILTLAAVAPLTVLALAACTQPATLPAIPTSSASATPTPTPTPGLSVAAIAGLAVREVGEGTVVSEGRHYQVGPGSCIATGMGHHHDFPLVTTPLTMSI